MVKDSINAFLDRIQEEELPLAQIGLSINKDQSIQQIQNLYKAKQQSTTSIGAAAPHGCG